MCRWLIKWGSLLLGFSAALGRMLGNERVFERLFQKLVYQFDPERRITLLRSSDDPELERYFDFMRSPGSTHMELDGHIYMKIHDKQNPSKGVWLEEFAHALQCIQYGNVPLSSDDRQRRERELEVAQCLKERAGRLHLLEEDMKHLEQAIEYYGQ